MGGEQRRQPSPDAAGDAEGAQLLGERLLATRLETLEGSHHAIGSGQARRARVGAEWLGDYGYHAAIVATSRGL